MTDEEAVALAAAKDDCRLGGGDPSRVTLDGLLAWKVTFPVLYQQTMERARTIVAALDANRQSAADRAVTELNRIVYGDPGPQ